MLVMQRLLCGTPMGLRCDSTAAHCCGQRSSLQGLALRSPRWCCGIEVRPPDGVHRQRLSQGVLCAEVLSPGIVWCHHCPTTVAVGFKCVPQCNPHWHSGGYKVWGGERRSTYMRTLESQRSIQSRGTLGGHRHSTLTGCVNVRPSGRAPPPHPPPLKRNAKPISSICLQRLCTPPSLRR